VLSVAALLRAAVALVLVGPMPLESDARSYFDLAAELASGEHAGAFYWPPGESAVLAAVFRIVGTSVTAARLVTIAESVATVALSAALARELAGMRAARVAGWIAALYPPSVLLCGQTYSQHLAALCLAALAYFGMRALRRRTFADFAAAGAALGLGCLTRPSTASVVPVLAIAWLLCARRAHALGLSQRKLVIGAAAAATVTLAVVAPAQLHDARAGAGWTISTNNERNLFLGNNPYTPDYKTSHLGQRSLDEIPPDARAYLESYYARPDSRAAMQGAALRYMGEHPARTAWRTLNRVTSFWGFDYLATRQIQGWLRWGAAAGLPLLALEAGGYAALASLALCALMVLRAEQDRGWRLWLVGLVLAYQIPYAIAFSGGTYHFPVMPLLVPFAATAIAHRPETSQRVRASRAALLALAVFALVQAQYGYYAAAMSG
jgi:4-amino-4-deoxy-L-arabinose transferase-like glycosyltransferase